jgi:hypothetical protein
MLPPLTLQHPTAPLIHFHAAAIGDQYWLVKFVGR